MISASYVWGHGEYYDYGWLVPPAAVLLSIRRWNDLDDGLTRDLRPGLVLAAVAVLLPWILVMRVFGYADPIWRGPIVVLGMTAAVASHVLLGATRGWKTSAGFILITLLWASSLPWPLAIEGLVINRLTRNVVAAVAEIFQLFGRPVDILGDRLQWHDTTVEVTDGCSGIRSFQSFVMATWFFAELQRLTLVRTLVLLMSAFGIAFAVNIGRTYTLAIIRFDYGEEAFHHAHDWLGLLAFVVSGVLFYVISGRLATRYRKTVVRTVGGGGAEEKLK